MPKAQAKLTPAQIAEVASLVASYITGQREKYAPRALPLSAQQRTVMSDFFSATLLDSVRVTVLRHEGVDNPDFYPALQNMGFKNLPDQSKMAAITFSDVVVSHEPFSSSLLFHELVHVEQYRQLGVQRFAELYVTGFLSGESYEAIPLEVNAYSLEGSFERNPSKKFLVENEVRRWIDEGRL